MKIQVDGKIIGELVNNVFTKYVNDKKHLYRRLDAYGIDLKVFEEALEPTNAQIVIHSDSGVYTTYARTYRTHGIVINEGFGRQIMLPRKYFDKENEYQDKLI